MIHPASVVLVAQYKWRHSDRAASLAVLITSLEASPALVWCAAFHVLFRSTQLISFRLVRAHPLLRRLG